MISAFFPLKNTKNIKEIRKIKIHKNKEIRRGDNKTRDDDKFLEGRNMWMSGK